MTRKSLDQKNRDILTYIMSEPHASVDMIAAYMKMPAPTAQKRIQRLMREGYLERVLRVIDLKALGYARYRIDMNVNPVELRHGEIDKARGNVKTQEELAQFIMGTLQRSAGDNLLIENVTILLGHHADLSATVWVKDTEVLRKFVTDELRGGGGIQDTSTALEAWSVQEAAREKMNARVESQMTRPKKVKGRIKEI